MPREIVTMADNCERRVEKVRRSFLVNGKGKLNKTIFFSMVKELSLCKSIQSFELGCGFNETFENFIDENLSTIVTLECENNSFRYIT